VVSIARNPPKGGLSRFFEQVLGKRYKVIGGRKRRIVKADEVTEIFPLSPTLTLHLTP